jgi:hypothetical protein
VEAGSNELRAASSLMQSFFVDAHLVFYFGHRSANEQVVLLFFFCFL